MIAPLCAAAHLPTRDEAAAPHRRQRQKLPAAFLGPARGILGRTRQRWRSDRPRDVGRKPACPWRPRSDPW
jgi:hypothetical protein